MSIDPRTGRLILDSDLNTGGGMNPSGFSTDDRSQVGYDGGGLYQGDTYGSPFPSSFCLLFVILAIASCVLSYYAWHELSLIDGRGLDVIMTTWGALVMIPVWFFIGAIILHSSLLPVLWSSLGVCLQAYNVFFVHDPTYTTAYLLCLGSAVCAVIGSILFCKILE